MQNHQSPDGSDGLDLDASNASPTFARMKCQLFSRSGVEHLAQERCQAAGAEL